MPPKSPPPFASTVANELATIRNRRNLPLSTLSSNAGENGDDSWSVTYIDLITLLLAFFIILVGVSQSTTATTSMSSTSANTSTTASIPVTEAPKQIATKPEPPSTPIAMPRKPPTETPPDMQALLGRLKGLPSSTPLSVDIQAGIASVTFPENLLFGPGSVKLNDEGYQLLHAIATRLHDAGVSFSIEGHTDNIPISTPMFASNWELSVHRATEVTRALIAGGIPTQRVRAVGYGDTHPVASNETEEGRVRNRRVALVMHLISSAPSAEGTTAEAQPAAGTEFAP